MSAMADAPRARLTYFAGWGLAEQTRWMLAAAGVEFSQVALRSHAEFEALRASGRLLFNQLPLLELDGLDLTQSQAMVRYVARRHGMDGGSAPADAAKVDMLCEGVRDARGVVVGFPFSPDPAEYRAEAPARLSRHLPFFERAIEVGGFAVAGRTLTAADVLLAELVEGAYARAERSLLSLSLSVTTPRCVPPGSSPLVPREFWAPYPKLVALHRRVTSLPSLRAYLDSDRRYPFPEGEIGAAYKANVVTVLGR